MSSQQEKKDYDEEQLRLMEEVCIVVDENDVPLRYGTKKECMFDCWRFIMKLKETHSNKPFRSFDGKYK